MSILNSQNCKFILHKYNELKQPHTSTWNAIINDFCDDNIIITDKTIIKYIRNYWGIDSMHLRRGQTKSITFSQQYYEFYMMNC